MLKNLKLKTDALKGLNLPVKVEAGFLGSLTVKVPWASLGKEPVIVEIDRVFLLVGPETYVEEVDEDYYWSMRAGEP